MKHIRVLLALGGCAGLVAAAGPAAWFSAAAAGGALLAWMFLVQRPAAWAPWFLALLALAPPLPLLSASLPLHPAALLFALALPALLLHGLRWGRDALSLLFLAFLAWLLVSAVLGAWYSGPALAAQSVVRWLLLAQGFVLFAWLAYGPQRVNENSLLRLLLVLGLLSAAFAILDFFVQLQPVVRFSEQYIYLPEGPRRRAQGVFYDAGALGNFCSLMLTLAAALAFHRQRLASPWLLWLATPALAFALVVSFSRGAIAGLAAALAVLIWRSRARLWRLLAPAAGLAAVAGVVAAAAPDIARLFFLRLEFSALQFFARPNEVLSTRLATWERVASLVAQEPQRVFLGVGYKTLPYTDLFGRPLVADNMYVSLLLEAGLPGLGLFLLLSFALLWRTWQMSRSTEPRLALLGGFLLAAWTGEMVQMLSADLLTYWRVTPVFLAVLGLAVRRESEQRSAM